MKYKPLLTTGLLLAPLAVLLAGESVASQICGGFNKDGRSITVKAPGLSAFSSGFLSAVEIAGEKRVLSSTAGSVQSITNSTESTPYGEAAVTTATIHFEAEHLDLMLRLGQIPGVPGVLFQAGILNAGQKPVKLLNLTPVQSSIKVEGDPADWLITRFQCNLNSGGPGIVCGLNGVTNGLAVEEMGGFYRRDGVGFLFAPVGEPIAYLNSSIIYQDKDRAYFNIESDMSGARVDPGEAHWGQQAILLMERPQAALTRQAEWVAKTHHARTDKGVMHGWCSWYLKTSQITGEDVLGIVGAVSNSAGRLRPGVIQIDDGYQDFDGTWDANAKFPEGMPFYAKKIAGTGARPGLWMALTMIGVKAPWLKDPANLETVWGGTFKKESPFRPDETGWIDPTQPRAKAYIADRVRHAVTSGFTYLKTDFNNIGEGGWYEKKKTSFEIMRDHYANIRQAAGEGTYILYCATWPNRATVGLVDASRISEDAHRGGIPIAIREALRHFDLNGRWYAIDMDCYYLATGLNVKGIGDITGGWPMLKTDVSMMGLSCGAAFTSDMWHWDAFKPYLRMTEIMTPPAQERTEVLDLCTSEEWSRLLSKVHRSWGDWSVALLWNPDQEAAAITLDFAKAGLDPAHRFSVWSFWDAKFLGIAKGQWTTPSLPVGGCQHIVLVDLDQRLGQPVVIGSNLHIFCGAAEFKNVNSTSTGIEIELTDAGAREGDLFLYSPKPLVVKLATGCAVNSVEAAGENIWKIHLEGRESGKPQKVSLSIAH